MGLGNRLKKAFGFASADDDYSEYEDSIDDVDARTLTTPEENTLADSPDPVEAPPSDDPQLAAEIFDTVIATFNEALPAFLRDSVDPKAQREYLYSQLQQSVRDHLARIAADAMRHSDAQWQQRQTSLRVELETYKDKLRRLDEKQNDAKQAQLSAERQKRALSERVHDLESKVLNLEAEAEQYDLEKKSLLNKLKVAKINDDDNSAMREEVEKLRAELEEARNAAKSMTPTDASTTSETAQTAAEPEIKLVDNPETERLLAEAIAENARLKTDASRIAKEHTKELNDAYATTKEMEAKLHIALKNNQELQQELDSVNEELRVAEQIQKTIEKFEDIKQRQDARIELLKKENDSLREELAKAAEKEKQTPPAPRPKANTQTDNATSEPKAAKEGNAVLDADKNKSAADPELTFDTKASAILFDDAFDDTSWVSTPSTASEPRPQDEFGYKPPKKRPAPPADDATRQLSLF